MLKEKQELVKSLVKEHNEVKGKLERLSAFLQKPKPEKVSDKEWLVLHDQLDAMADYHDCLLTRIVIHTTDEKDAGKPAGVESLAQLESE